MRYTSLILAALTGFLAANTTFAATTGTLTMSPNLAALMNDPAQFSDTGFVTATFITDVNNDSVWTISERRTLQPSFQDSTGQWFARTLVEDVRSFDGIGYETTWTSREINVTPTAPPSSDQWLRYSGQSDQTIVAAFDVFGTPGRRTTALGVSQIVSPGVLASANSEPLPPEQYIWQDGPDSWNYQAYQSLYLHDKSSFEFIAQATDGGTFTFISINLYTEPTDSEVREGHFSYVKGTWFEDTPIATPVPEPESWAMLLAGLGVMGAVARRKRATQR